MFFVADVYCLVCLPESTNKQKFGGGEEPLIGLCEATRGSGFVFSFSLCLCAFVVL